MLQGREIDAVRAPAPQKTLLLSPTFLPDPCRMKTQPLLAAQGLLLGKQLKAQKRTEPSLHPQLALRQGGRRYCWFRRLISKESCLWTPGRLIQ